MNISAAPAEIQTAVSLLKRRPNILFVDDHQLIRDEFHSALVGKGWNCQCANDGEDALRLLAAAVEPFDILITDHSMPGMNGLELVGKVRALKFSGKILVHSTMLMCAERAAYDDFWVDAIVLKSGNPEFLFKAIEESLREKTVI